MSDRFRFRVWLEYAKLYYSLDSFYYDRLKNKYTFHFEDGHTKTIKEKDFVIEQCTGLKDKNGKLIYEGDLIKEPANSHNLKVIWENGAWQTEEYRKNGHREQLLYCLVNCYCVEIVGNIHENGELLK